MSRTILKMSSFPEKNAVYGFFVTNISSMQEFIFYDLSCFFYGPLNISIFYSPVSYKKEASNEKCASEEDFFSLSKNEVHFCLFHTQLVYVCTDVFAFSLFNRKADRRTGRQADRRTGGQADRRTDRNNTGMCS